MRLETRWSNFTKKNPLVVACGLGLWAIIMAFIYAIGGFFVGFATSYSESYEKNKFGVVCASILFLFLSIMLLWHPWQKQKSVSKPTTTKVTSKKQQPLSNQEVKVPEATQPTMPIKAEASGLLDGTLVILDPGHGGKTQWAGVVDPGSQWQFGGQTYYEAAYTYRLAKEIGDLILQNGGDVAYTAWSPTMEISTLASQAMPLPTVPLLPDGSELSNNGTGLNARADAANNLYQSQKDNYKLFTFVSLHIDSMGEGWDGLHVCYDRRANKIPRLAELVSEAIADGRYSRRYKGVTKETLEARGLAVLNSSHNPLKQRILLECGIPGDPNDSWRLRDEASRRKMLGKVVLDPLIQLKDETDKKGSIE
jgi:N-acetylmuramoyl-L-alanine amidase